MSVSEARRFLEAGKKRPELRRAVSDRIAGLPDDEILPALLEVAASREFEFSEAEYLTAAAHLVATELTVDQLEKVYGGSFAFTFIRTWDHEPGSQAAWIAIISF